MEPTRSPQATLNDLLDRILDNGILLNTDLIISVAGIPLIGVNLKLALAGMETMLKYGIMADWDEAQRAVAAKAVKTKQLPIEKNEYVIFSTFGSHWYSKGIYECWRAGMIYITNRRIIMFRKEPAEILFQTSYELIKGMTIKEKPHFTGIKRQELYLMLESGEIIPMHSNDTLTLKEALDNVLREKRLVLEESISIPEVRDMAHEFLEEKEDLTEEGKMWHLIKPRTEGEGNKEWKPGHLYLTDKRLCFWYDFDKKMVVDIPSKKLVHVYVEGNGFESSLVGENSLIVLYRDGNENKVALFSGDDNSSQKWEKAIGKRIIEQESEINTETCPRCGKIADRNTLLTKGCSRCGWVSHRLERP